MAHKSTHKRAGHSDDPAPKHNHANTSANADWRKTAKMYHFGLFVSGKYIGEVTMLGDNNGHARTRFLDQALDKKKEYITLVPRVDKITEQERSLLITEHN